jgi:hypothetical protein
MFDVCSVGTPPCSITVTAPNGGETLNKESPYDITWFSSGSSGAVNIDLYQGGSFHSSIASVTPDDGLHSWTPPAALAAGTDYRIRVTDSAVPSCWDDSNADFSIAGPAVAATWARTYGGLGNDFGNSIQQTSDGGFIVTGSTDFGAGWWDAWVLKLNALGEVTWEKTYGGDDFDWGESVLQTSDGGFIVAGGTRSFGVSGGADNFWILKLDALGNIACGESDCTDGNDNDLDGLIDEEWQRIYGTADSSERAWSIQQTSDGGFIVAGQKQESLFVADDDFWVLKLDAYGNVGSSFPGTWQKSYGGAASEIAYSIQQTSDGGYIVAGRTEDGGGPGFPDFWVLKLDAGGNIACGESDCTDGNDNDLDGLTDEEWQKTYGGTSGEIAYSIQQTCDDINCTNGIDDDGDGYTDERGYVVAGQTQSFGASSPNSPDIWVLKVDTFGNILWQKTYGGSMGDGAYSIQQTPDGNYIVAGRTSSFGAGSFDFWVLKLDAWGNIACGESDCGDGNDNDLDGLTDEGWQKTYGGSYWEQTASIRETSDGGFVVAGSTEYAPTSYDDFWILKLDTYGNIDSSCPFTIGNTDISGDGGATVVVTSPTVTVTDTTDTSALTPVSGVESEAAVNEQCSGAACTVVSDIVPDAPTLCAGDSVTLDANPSGGTPPYTYLWSTGEVTRMINVAPVAPTTYTVAVADAGGCSASSSETVTVEQCPDPVPSLTYSGSTASDCGNNDGVIDQRERIDLSVELENLGDADAYNVGGVLSTPTKGIIVISDTASFPDIPAGLSKTSLEPFVFRVKANVPCGTVIDFTLDFSYEDASGDLFSDSASFQLQVGTGGTPVCNPNCGCPPISAKGDTDANGCADGLDLMRLARSFGSVCGEGDFLNDADLDDNDWVDGNDLDALIKHFGNGCGAP